MTPAATVIPFTSGRMRHTRFSALLAIASSELDDAVRDLHRRGWSRDRAKRLEDAERILRVIEEVRR